MTSLLDEFQATREWAVILEEKSVRINELKR